MIIIFNYNFDDFSDEIKKKLCIENEKEMYIYLSMFSKVLSLYKVYKKKCKLITSALCPKKESSFSDDFELNIIKNIISICAALFYYCVAKDNCCDNTDPTDCSYSYSLTTETFALIAAFISLYNTFYKKQRQCLEDTSDEEDDDIIPNIPVI